MRLCQSVKTVTGALGTHDFSGPGIVVLMKEIKGGTTLRLGFAWPCCDMDINSVHLGCTQRHLKHGCPAWSYVEHTTTRYNNVLAC